MKKNLLALIVIAFIQKPVFCQVSFVSLTTSTTQNLLGISFADTSIGYACGEGSSVIKTTNGGSSWSNLTTGTTEKIWDIKVIPNSAGQKLVAVGDNNTVIKSMIGGLTWVAQSIPFQAGSFVFGIQCIDSLNYVACGGDFATTSGAILKTTNGGTTWTKTAVPGSIFLDKIQMLNSSDGFSVGTNTSFSDGSIQKISGSTFSAVKTSPNIIANLWCNSISNIVTVGIGGQIWKSTNAGSTWTSHSYNTTDLYGIAFTDSLHGYACGGTTAGNIILSTSNGGVSWVLNPFTFSGIFQSICIVSNKIFIAGDQGNIVTSTLSSLSINNQSSTPQIAIFPNPSTDLLHLVIPAGTDVTAISLTDLSGRLVKTCNIQSLNTTISLKELPYGEFIHSIYQKNVRIQSGKIMHNNKYQKSNFE